MLEAVAALGYGPITSPPACAAHDARSVGIVVPDITNPFFTGSCAASRNCAARTATNPAGGQQRGAPARERRAAARPARRAASTG